MEIATLIHVVCHSVFLQVCRSIWSSCRGVRQTQVKDCCFDLCSKHWCLQTKTVRLAGSHWELFRGKCNVWYLGQELAYIDKAFLKSLLTSLLFQSKQVEAHGEVSTNFPICGFLERLWNWNESLEIKEGCCLLPGKTHTIVSLVCRATSYITKS